MRRFIYFILTLTFISVNLYSQNDEEFTVPQRKGFIGSVGIGVGAPIGELDHGYRGNINVNANAGYIFSNLIGVRLDAVYSKFSLDAAYEGGDMSIVSVRGDFLIGDFKKTSKIILYGLAGAGIYFKKAGDLILKLYNELVYHDGTETDLGFAVGGGAALKLKNKVFFFGEMQYNLSFSNKLAPATFVPIKVGLMLIP